MKAVGKYLERIANSPLALTFKDVILLPSFSTIEPREVDLSTNITVNLRGSTPIVSSPMDTVTESALAIAMAMLGGLGVIHRNCSSEEQVNMVKKVKEAEVRCLKKVYLYSHSTIEEAEKVFRKTELESVPVINKTGSFVGYLSRRKLSSCDPQDHVYKCAEKGPVLRIKDLEKNSLNSQNIAVVDDNGRLFGVLANEGDEDIVSLLDEEGRLAVAAAISPFSEKRVELLEKWVDAFVVDVAHFHNINCISATKKLLKKTSREVVVGNIGTYEACVDIITSLDDVAGLRVGIASGSICSTGIVTGVAAPTLFAVASVRDALEDYGASKIPIIADGGIGSPGDAAKALAAGASSVMLGRALAGTSEASSPLIRVGGRLYKLYRGMGSKSALAERYSADRYSAPSKKIAEGVEGLVPYRGSVEGVVREFREGLKAALGYVGAKNIPELWQKARFARLTSVGFREVLPHDIVLDIGL